MEEQSVWTSVQGEEDLEINKRKKDKKKKKQPVNEQPSSSSSSLSPSSWRDSLKRRSDGDLIVRWQDKKEVQPDDEEEEEDLPLPALVLRLSSSQDRDNELSISSSIASSPPILDSLSLSMRESQEAKEEDEKQKKNDNEEVFIDRDKKDFAITMTADQPITSLISSSSSSSSPSLSSSSSSCCPSYHTSRSTSCDNIPPLSSSSSSLPSFSLSCSSGDSELHQDASLTPRLRTGEKKELSWSEEETRKERREEDCEREQKKHGLMEVTRDQSGLEKRKEMMKKEKEVENLKEEGRGRNQEEAESLPILDQQTLQHEEDVSPSRVLSQEVSLSSSVEADGLSSEKEEEREKNEGSLFNDKRDGIPLHKARGEGGVKEEEEEEEEATTAITVVALHHYHEHQSKVTSLSCSSSGVYTPQEEEGEIETGDRKTKDLESLAQTPQQDSHKPRDEDEKKEGEKERQMEGDEWGGKKNSSGKKKEDSTEEEVKEEEEKKKKIDAREQGDREMSEERQEDQVKTQKEKEEQDEEEEERRNKGRRVQELLSSTTQVMMQRLQILKESLITREEMIETLISRCREREEELKFLKELFPAIMSENLNLREELFHTKRSLSNANLLLKSNRRRERYGEKEKGREEEGRNYQPPLPSQIPFLRLPLSPLHSRRRKTDDENEHPHDRVQKNNQRSSPHHLGGSHRGKGLVGEKVEEEEEEDDDDDEKTACCIVNLDEEDEDEEELERRRRRFGEGGGDSSFSFDEVVEYENEVEYVREREEGRKQRTTTTRKKRRRKRIISPESQWWGIDEGVIEEEEEEEEENDGRMRKIDITPSMVEKSSQTGISFPHSHQTHRVSFDLSSSQRKRTSSSLLHQCTPSPSSSSSSPSSSPLGRVQHQALCCSPSSVLPSPRCSSSSLLRPSAYATFLRWKYREKRRERKEGWRKRGSRRLTIDSPSSSSSSSPLHVADDYDYVHPVHLSPVYLLLRGNLRRRTRSKLQDEGNEMLLSAKINILSNTRSRTVSSRCSPPSPPASPSSFRLSSSSFLDEEKNDEQWISHWLRLQFKSEFCLTPPESLSRDISLANTTSPLTTSHTSSSPLCCSLADFSSSFSSYQAHQGYQENKNSLCLGETYHRDVESHRRCTPGASFEREREEEQGRRSEGDLDAEADRAKEREVEMKKEERQNNKEKQTELEERDHRESTTSGRRISPSALVGSKICWWWIFLLNPSGF